MFLLAEMDLEAGLNLHTLNAFRHVKYTKMFSISFYVLKKNCI